MEELVVFAPDLTDPDRLLLKNLANDIVRHRTLGKVVTASGKDDQSKAGLSAGKAANGHVASSSLKLRPRKVDTDSSDANDLDLAEEDARDLAALRARNDAGSSSFEPTVFVSVDYRDLKLHPVVDRYIFQPYVRWAATIARRPSDVVMVTHLLLYFGTSVPSAVLLFRHFTYLHAVLHLLMTGYYVGTYTLMMHQHIHMRGILSPRWALLDRVFPYITDPLMGHTWNTYFYHHVKHHHVEGNGPDDLSSTLRYQRDSVAHFLAYVGRFYLLVWLELPLYFLSKRRPGMALRAAGSELANIATYILLWRLVSWRATLFVFVLPLLIMRIGLMVGNWGQHAFVDPDEPDSDFRSSITLIDVASNRYCFNDGYHTSHHLNPLRHWRDHPTSFLQQKQTYAQEGALVFHNIDYIMITVRLMMKDYTHLAKCLVPIGDQMSLSLEERATMLRERTRRFSEDEIRQKFVKTR